MSTFTVENGGEETWGRGAGQPAARLCRTFFFFTVPSFAIDRRRGISQSHLQSHSSQDEVGLWDMIKKVKTKTSLPIKNGEKFMETKTGLRSSTDRSWVVLVRRFKRFNNNSKTRYLSGAVAYFTTQYNVHNDNQQDTCWARFAWKDARPPLIFPTTKWRKKNTE